jgi:hypothetical protein
MKLIINLIIQLQMENMYLNLSTSIKCRIHPIVLFNILDHHVRRQEGQERGLLKMLLFNLKLFFIPQSIGIFFV